MNDDDVVPGGASLVIDKNVMVPMRDGVRLATDVYRPNRQGQFPTLVERMPYNKEVGAIANVSFDVLRAAQVGFAVVVQDTRGRYGSEGTFSPFADEAFDGADTIAWAAEQPWSNGRVGMVGASYFGATQWLAATQGPAALKALAPALTASSFYDGWTYHNGALQLGFVNHWTFFVLGLGEAIRQVGAGTMAPARIDELIHQLDINAEFFERLPLLDMPELSDVAPYYREWLSHPGYDDYWKATAPREGYEQITVPALNIGGWYDPFLKGTLENYVGMKRRGGSPAARRLQRLIVGPWAHGGLNGQFPERSFGLLGGFDGADVTGAQLDWFTGLLGDTGAPEPVDNPVRIFVMGVDGWRDEPDWPLPDTDWQNWYLDSDGGANTATGDGRLTMTAPAVERADRYVYDPHDPVPTMGGATFLPGLTINLNAGPRDQRSIEARPDVLCYTSAELDADLEVTGPVTATIFFSSDAQDTDVTGKLVDVYPDGHAMNVCEGVLRTRYRHSLSDPEPLQPGEIHELPLDLVATANRFAAGHRIRLELSSSNYPRFDRNSNTGGVIAEEAAPAYRTARNRVHHSPAHPSRLLLPVVRRSGRPATPTSGGPTPDDGSAT